jgi:serine/threonine-protein kinase
MNLLAGKYRLERVIGQGGMGVVVAAMHVQLDERVAIKLLLPDALASAETVARFQREARAAVRIKSEHVARVSDVGNVDAAAVPLQASLGVPLALGAPFMVMEYLEGQDLAGVLRTAGPLAIGDATSYLAQAIEAIAEAHSYGIVHRDLKPSNLFLTRRPDGTALVKVLDFGISKAQAGSPLDAQMTTTSAVLGSPMYMAPEQMIASREVDGRTDVWSLGVVLYQLLTGRGPFNAATMTELCARILQEPHAPIRATRPDVPAELEAVVARCLEKDRTRRFPSVADLAEAIAPFGGHGAVMSAERARRLIPRTERASQAHHDAYAMGIGATVAAGATPNPGAFPAMGASTNPSWSNTRRRSSSSGVWIALVVGLAGIVACVALVVLFIAARSRAAPVVASPPIALPDQSTAPPPAATTTDPTMTELAPLHVSDSHTPQAVPHARAQPPAAAAATTTTATRSAPPPPPPTQTAQPKPDIF